MDERKPEGGSEMKVDLDINDRGTRVGRDPER